MMVTVVLSLISVLWGVNVLVRVFVVVSIINSVMMVIYVQSCCVSRVSVCICLKIVGFVMMGMCVWMVTSVK